MFRTSHQVIAVNQSPRPYIFRLRFLPLRGDPRRIPLLASLKPCTYLPLAGPVRFVSRPRLSLTVLSAL